MFNDISGYIDTGNTDIVLLIPGLEEFTSADPLPDLSGQLNTLVNNIFTQKPDIKLVMAKLPTFINEGKAADISGFNNYTETAISTDWSGNSSNIKFIDLNNLKPTGSSDKLYETITTPTNPTIMAVGGDFTAGLTDFPNWTYPFRHGYREGLWNRLRFQSSDLSGSVFVGDSDNGFIISGGEEPANSKKLFINNFFVNESGHTFQIVENPSRSWLNDTKYISSTFKVLEYGDNISGSYERYIGTSSSSWYYSLSGTDVSGSFEGTFISPDNTIEFKNNNVTIPGGIWTYQSRDAIITANQNKHRSVSGATIADISNNIVDYITENNPDIVLLIPGLEEFKSGIIPVNIHSQINNLILKIFATKPNIRLIIALMPYFINESKSLELKNLAADLSQRVYDLSATYSIEIVNLNNLKPTGSSDKLHVSNIDPPRIMCLGGDLTAGLTDFPNWTYPFRHGYREGLWNRLRFQSSDLSGSVFVGDSDNDFIISVPETAPYGDYLYVNNFYVNESGHTFQVVEDDGNMTFIVLEYGDNISGSYERYISPMSGMASYYPNLAAALGGSPTASANYLLGNIQTLDFKDNAGVTIPGGKWTYQSRNDIINANQNKHKSSSTGSTIVDISNNIVDYITNNNPDIVLLIPGVAEFKYFYIPPDLSGQLNNLVQTIFTKKPQVRLVIAKLPIIINEHRGDDIIAFNSYIDTAISTDWVNISGNIEIIDIGLNNLSGGDEQLLLFKLNDTLMQHPTNLYFDRVASAFYDAIHVSHVKNSLNFNEVVFSHVTNLFYDRVAQAFYDKIITFPVSSVTSFSHVTNLFYDRVAQAFYDKIKEFPGSGVTSFSHVTNLFYDRVAQAFYDKIITFPVSSVTSFSHATNLFYDRMAAEFYKTLEEFQSSPQTSITIGEFSHVTNLFYHRMGQAFFKEGFIDNLLTEGNEMCAGDGDGDDDGW